MKEKQKNNGEFTLKLHSKKLASGKCQVKFYANTRDRKCLYGYTLVEAEATLKDVVKTITDKLKQKQSIGSYYHSHLFELGRKQEDWTNFMIFEV